MTIDDSRRHDQGGVVPDGAKPIAADPDRDDSLDDPAPGERAAGWIDPEETAPIDDLDPEDTAPIEDVDPEDPNAQPVDSSGDAAEDVTLSATDEDDLDTGISEPTD